MGIEILKDEFIKEYGLESEITLLLYEYCDDSEELQYFLHQLSVYENEYDES